MANYNTGDYVNFNHKWNYPLQWIYESEMARFDYQRYIFRVALMTEGKPSRNVYQDDLFSNLKRLSEADRKECETYCTNVPEGHSFVLADAVRTISSQLASGVDTYEYEIHDPFMTIDPDTEDRLAAQCSMDYVENKLDLLQATFTADMLKYGLTAVLVKYDVERDKNVVKRIHPKNIWFDTMYSSTGQERFRGYSTMISWRDLKDMIEREGDEINTSIEAPNESIFDDKGNVKRNGDKGVKVSKRKIRTLNGLDIYVQDINRLATSPDLTGWPSLYGEYDHDLRTCYNLNWYHTYATDPKAQTNSRYGGQDVELTVMYDIKNQIEFKIINRRYVISMNKQAFKRNIIFSQPNPLTNTMMYRFRECQIECPLLFGWEQHEEMDKYAHPSSSLFSLLDLHDDLCGWNARREHVSKILSILRIETNGADGESLKSVMNIMGIVIDNIQGDIKSMNLQYAYDPIDSQIERLTNTIQYHLSAYTQFDAMQTMGDRASSAEAGMAQGAIAQGLTPLQNSLMSLDAEIARLSLLNRVVYSPSSIFPITNHGQYSAVTAQEMALNAIIRVKSKMANKSNERMAATNALALLGSAVGQSAPDELKSYLLQQALFGQVPRRIAALAFGTSAPSPEETALAMQQAQNQAQMLQQNQQAYVDNPIPYEVNNMMDTMSGEDVDAVIAGLNNGGGEEIMVSDKQMEVQPLDVSQEGAMTADIANSPELGSQLANPDGLV